MGKVNSIQQHAPLVIPENWNSQEKRLVIQLEEILDDIYRRFGRLRLSDFSGETRGKLTAIFTDGPDKLHNTVVDIDSNGIHMLTGLFRVDADDEQSYIRFGGTSDEPKFLLGIDGNVLARNGSFKTLYVNGEEVASSGGTRLVVSDTKPEGSDILWVRPIATSTPTGTETSFTLKANAADQSAPGRTVDIPNGHAGEISGECTYTIDFWLTNVGDSGITISACVVDLTGRIEGGSDDTDTVRIVANITGGTMTPGGMCHVTATVTGTNILYSDLTAAVYLNTQSSTVRFASTIKLTCSGNTASGETPSGTVQDVEIKYIT